MLETAIKIFLIGSSLFFVVWFSLCLNWSGRKLFSLQNVVAASMVSALYTFKILLLGFVFFVLINLVWLFL